MSTLPNMGIALPTLGADRGTWDDKINAGFALVDAHDHTSGKGLPITVAALDIDANIPMGGFALVNLGEARFSPIPELAAGSTILFVDEDDNELYWRTSAGANVQLTNGTSINTTLVGGIVGDYSSVGAEVAYDDGDDRYTFKQAAATGWARIASGSVRIFETGTSESVYVGLKAPAALGASYDVTFATALPGTQKAIQISSVGDLVYSNAFTGDVSATGDIAATGKVTGTVWHHTEAITRSVPGCMALDDEYEVGGVASHAKARGGTSNVVIGIELGNNVDAVMYPLLVESGETITGFTLYLHKDSANTTTITAKLYRYRATLDSETEIASGTNALNAPGATTIPITSLTETSGSGYQYYVKVWSTGAVASERLESLDYFVTRP